MTADLEAIGFYVMRSAGSKGAADLIAIAPQGKPVLFVQCKTHWIFKAPEWNTFLEAAKLYAAMPIFAGMRDDEIVYYRLLGQKSRSMPDGRPWELVAFTRQDQPT